jgi:hypothetical protein
MLAQTKTAEPKVVQVHVSYQPALQGGDRLREP